MLKKPVRLIKIVQFVPMWMKSKLFYWYYWKNKAIAYTVNPRFTGPRGGKGSGSVNRGAIHVLQINLDFWRERIRPEKPADPVNWGTVNRGSTVTVKLSIKLRQWRLITKTKCYSRYLNEVKIRDRHLSKLKLLDMTQWRTLRSRATRRCLAIAHSTRFKMQMEKTTQLPNFRSWS